MAHLTRKVLAFGQLTNSKADLYVPAAGRTGFVHHMELHNTHTAAVTVTLNYHDGSSEEQMYKVSIDPDDTLHLDFRGEGSVVNGGAKVTGLADTTTIVTYKFSGVEEVPDAAAAGVSSNLWALPDTPHAQDDEFEASTLVGWDGVENTSDGTSGTFSYDTVDPYDTAFNSGDVVRVNVNPPEKPSWALIQVPSRNKFYCIYKAYTLPTNLLVVARMKFNMRTTGIVNNDSVVGISFRELTTGKPTSNSKVATFLNETDTGACQAQASRTTSGAATIATETTNVSYEGQALHYAAVHKVGTTYHCWTGTSDGNWIFLASYSGLDFTPDSIAIVAANNSVSDPGVSVVAVDFVRFFETDKFLL